MDELKQVWEDIKKKKNNLTDFSSEEINKSISSKSKGTMQSIRKKVLHKLYYTVFFTLVIAVYVPFASPLPSQALLLLLLVAYLIGCILFYQEYKLLGKQIELDMNLLHASRLFRDRIKKVLHYEELVGLILYPFSVTAGFMIGLTLEDDRYMDRPLDWIVLVIVILVVTPGAHWLAKWMNRKAFGKYIERLENNIGQLEKIEG